MQIKFPKFIGSYTDVKTCPSILLKEFAFIGRSNVGKSSLLNMIVGNSKLAKTSATPGKTQLINLFDIDNKFIIADLPGYGYAKLSKSKRASFALMIKNYLLKRENLYTAFLLFDSRIPAQTIDLEMADWMGENQIPFNIIYTKTDKLSENQLQAQLDQMHEKLFETWVELPNIIISSSKNELGKDTILSYIKNHLK